MTNDPTETEIMGRAPAAEQGAADFRAVNPENTLTLTFGTIGRRQEYMDWVIQSFAGDQSHAGDPARLRAFFDHNAVVLDELDHNPRFEKAAGVIRAQFAKALGEG